MTNIKLMLNAREHLERVLTEAGMEITDSGMLMDDDQPRADLGLKIDGQPFSLQLRWRYQK